MPRFLRRIIRTVVLLFFSARVWAQPELVLQKLHEHYNPEKIYVHVDRGVYLPSETIWFKAYLFAGSFPSQTSSIVYVDLLNSMGKVVDRQVLPVECTCAGFSGLPAFLCTAPLFP